MEYLGGVLLIDDEIHVLDAYTMGLEMLGFKVMGVGDGQEAVDSIKKYRFDAIISDVKLPRVNGVEIFQVAEEFQPDTKFIFFTGHGKGSPALKAIEAKGIAVLTKPVGFEVLAKFIKNAKSHK